VSTLDQDPDLAIGELRAYAARLSGAGVALEVTETGSGARNDRPGWQKILEAARRGQVDCVAVWKLDRAGRSALDLLANIQALNDAGVRFVAVTQGIDLKPGGDALSKLLLTMLAGVAEFERTLIVERTRLGIAKARREGKRLGRPPAVDKPTPQAVRRLRARGMSWTAVAAELGCTVARARRRASA
jgi:DNA invertase Pin-like site-specific DNA recombinase